MLKFIISFLLFLSFPGVVKSKPKIPLESAWSVKYNNQQFTADQINFLWSSLENLPDGESAVEYTKVFKMDTLDNIDTVFLVLPPIWVPYRIWINKFDITPVHYNGEIASRVYASAMIPISKQMLHHNNTIHILAHGEKVFGGFRNDTIFLGFDNRSLTPLFWRDFLLNDIHWWFASLSFLITILCIFLAILQTSRRSRYIYLAIASLTIIPHHLLTTSFYEFIFSSSSQPFRFQLFCQTVSWSFFSLVLAVTSQEADFLLKIIRHKYFIFFGTVFLSLNVIFAFLTSFSTFVFLSSPIFAVPAILSPFCVYRNRNDYFVFLCASFGTIFTYLGFVSHAFGLNLFLHGYGAALFSITGLYFLLSDFIRSSLRDRSAGQLLQRLLPKSAYQKVTHLFDKGATIDEVRAALKTDSTVSTIFVDICRYGRMAETIPTKIVYETRSEIFDFLKVLCFDSGLEVVKTIGDSIHFVGGLAYSGVISESRIATSCLSTVVKILDNVDALNILLKEKDLPSISLKISATIGLCEYGLEGSKKDLRFDVQGHWVNLAKRFEEAMDSAFYQKYSKNVALVSEDLCLKCEDLNLRKRFTERHVICDKHQTEYVGYVGRQYQIPVNHDDFLAGIYGQFSHNTDKSEATTPIKLVS